MVSTAESVRVFLADELAGVLVQPVQPRVIAAARQRERQPAEGEHLDLKLRARLGDYAHGGERQFHRRAKRHRAARRKKLRRSLIIDVDERPRHERPAGARGQGGHIVYLDEAFAAAQFGDGLSLPRARRQRQRRIDSVSEASLLGTSLAASSATSPTTRP